MPNNVDGSAPLNSESDRRRPNLPMVSAGGYGDWVIPHRRSCRVIIMQETET